MKQYKIFKIASAVMLACGICFLAMGQAAKKPNERDAEREKSLQSFGVILPRNHFSSALVSSPELIDKAGLQKLMAKPFPLEALYKNKATFRTAIETCYGRPLKIVAPISVGKREGVDPRTKQIDHALGLALPPNLKPMNIGDFTEQFVTLINGVQFLRERDVHTNFVEPLTEVNAILVVTKSTVVLIGLPIIDQQEDSPEDDSRSSIFDIVDEQ